MANAWQPPRRADLKVGDVVLSPQGEEQAVVEVDLQRDVIVTASGETWGMEDLEAAPAPDLTDPESVERWLRIAGQVIPRRTMEHRSVECSCGCRSCYRLDMWEPVPNTTRINNFRSSHFRNSSQCSCEREGCPCRS